jgi:hypothetical protein
MSRWEGEGEGVGTTVLAVRLTRHLREASVSGSAPQVTDICCLLHGDYATMPDLRH